jgi:hypothetical protein
LIQDGSNNKQELQQYQQQQLTITQTRHAIINSSTLDEPIDLISPPISPVPTTQQSAVSHPTFTEEYLSYVDNMMHDSFMSTQYQVNIAYNHKVG